MNSDAGRTQSTDEIRADIERTRERLGDTVEALGAQLNPSLLKQRVKDSVHEATIGRVKNMASNARDKAEESGRGLLETLRDNPIPAAMIAGGIGWLLFNKRKTSIERSVATEVDYDYRGAVRSGNSADVESADYSRQFPQVEQEGVAHRVASSAKDAGGKVASTARDAGEKVASTARTVGEKVSSSASSVAHGVADTARAGTARLEETMHENPMVLGVVAAAVGLAVGMTLPASERESRLMGSKRDELIDKAKDAISETKDKVRNVAERAVPEVGAALKEVAREEGLTA
jgi:ElaB/YqjD/DUF883 family membrane-anchored ribosome-binding protein